MTLLSGNERKQIKLHCKAGKHERGKDYGKGFVSLVQLLPVIMIIFTISIVLQSAVH